MLPVMRVAPLMIAAGTQALDIVGLVTNIIEYRTRIYEIDLEIERVRMQAEVMHHRIDAEHDIAIKHLSNERVVWEKRFKVLEREQDQTFVQTNILLQGISLLVEKMTDKETSLVEKQLYATAMSSLNQVIAGNQQKQIEIFHQLTSAIDSEQLPLSLGFNS